MFKNNIHCSLKNTNYVLSQIRKNLEASTHCVQTLAEPKLVDMSSAEFLTQVIGIYSTEGKGTNTLHKYTYTWNQTASGLSTGVVQHTQQFKLSNLGL